MATELSGATLPLVWALPFAGLLVSIAVVPLISAGFWHAHYGKVALAWTLGLVVPYAVTFGAPGTLHLLVDSLLRRDDVDEFAQLAIEIVPPPLIDVAIEAHRLVLREHQNPPQPAVEAIRQCEVHDSIHAAERHGRFRPVPSERTQTRSFSAGQNDG